MFFFSSHHFVFLPSSPKFGLLQVPSICYLLFVSLSVYVFLFRLIVFALFSFELTPRTETKVNNKEESSEFQTFFSYQRMGHTIQVLASCVMLADTWQEGAGSNRCAKSILPKPLIWMSRNSGRRLNQNLLLGLFLDSTTSECARSVATWLKVRDRR